MSTSTSDSQKFRYEHYIQFPDDGRRHEIIDGDHYVNPAPGTQHQSVSKHLQYQLYTKIELAGLGLFFSAPVDVQLSDFDIVQPDLVIVLNKSIKRITPTKIKVAPDLVVEILSPSTAGYDNSVKKQLYERSGVAEYWVVDPFEQKIDQWVLKDGKYVLQPAAVSIRLSILPDITIETEKLW
jgi:Uma2 family endonuclease